MQLIVSAYLSDDFDEIVRIFMPFYGKLCLSHDFIENKLLF